MDRAPPPKISWAEAGDAERLVPLLIALHRHDISEAAELSHDQVLAHARRLLDPATPHRLVLAWDETGAPIGLAAIATFVSVSDPRPERSTQIELKELFVLPDHRGAGIGEALMAWVDLQALETGACRVDWHVKRDNHRGIAFYRRCGGDVVADRLSMRKRIATSRQ